MQKEYRPWAAGLRNLCLKKLNDFGGKGTARQIADNLGKDIGLISPRLDELAELGVICDSGERVRQGRGRPLTVWEVVDLSADCDQPTCQDEAEAPAWFRRFGN